jgi:hypothetical protein
MLSIVRTLPNAPDFYLRFVADDSVGCHSRWFTGKASTGSQESLSQRPADAAGNLPCQFQGDFSHDISQDTSSKAHETAPGCPRHDAQG